MLNKTTPAAELNLKHPASVAFSLPAVPPCPRQDSSRYTGDEELYNQIEFFFFFFFLFVAHMEVYSGSLFVPVNPTDPPQNPVSTTEGSVWGPRRAPDRWCRPERWQGDCLPQRDSGDISWKNIALDIQSLHTEPPLPLSLSLCLSLCIQTPTRCRTVVCFYGRAITSRHKSEPPALRDMKCDLREI